MAEAGLTQAWDAPALERALARELPGLRVDVSAQVDSTNTRLLEAARAGDASPCLLVAEAQTGGRGRQGRRWQSAPGASLTFSLRTTIARDDWSGLSLAVGLALADAIDPGTGPAAIGLKWPNDLLLASAGDAGVLTRKLGGILIESIAAGSGWRVAVIGIGLNVAPLVLNELSNELSQGYACAQELRADIDAPRLLAIVAAPLLAALRTFERHGFAPLKQRYAARDLLAGQPVTTTLDEARAGIAEGVDDDGALWVRAGGVRHRVVGGEVSVRSSAAGSTGGAC
jgi:BirA family transcriptional regulator, biotin operon repressor / biotin---[acetyl-CoA-carboxylase] ligase